MWTVSFSTAVLIVLGVWPTCILAADTLSTSGFSSCSTNSDIQVKKLDISYTRSTRQVTFDVAGTSEKEQNVTASLVVYAYGNEVYSKDFNPCSSDNYIEQLCPIPTGSFSATGSQQIPESFSSQIPSIAFSIPDLDGQAKLQLKSLDQGNEVACIKSELSNGKSIHVPGVSYAAAGVAGAALVVSGLSAIGAAGKPGAPSSSPGFGEVMGWFHSMATNGMLSVNYPPIYRSFAKNFAFSTGLIPWNQMQMAIDNFRSSTGGNLTDNNYKFLKNATLVYSNGSSSDTSSKLKRGLHLAIGVSDLAARSFSTSFDESDSDHGDNGDDGGIQHVVSGIDAFPQKLRNFRNDYWGLLGRTVTNLILVLYGIWVLYCVYQLSSGDSWAAKVLAAVTLAIFTAVLLFFAFRIFTLARKYRKAEGDAYGLYENKETWRKYSLFYDNYKKDYWWLFVPLIVYMFAKGCILAAGNGHGLVQSAGQLIVEALLLILLLWYRPYVTKSSQWINITIQIVRVLSVICVLVFVEELGLAQTTKTVTGVVLIAVQSALTGVLAILIATNAIILCIRKNPHVQQRKEAEKMNRDVDDLTPLDARESLLMEHHPPRKDDSEMSKFNFTGPYQPYHDHVPRHSPTGSTDHLVGPNYSLSNQHRRSFSRDSHDSNHSFDGRPAAAPGYGLRY
ncbi:DUF907 domain-containing protein [Aspergillus sclerotialis]|uniref:DUF907 domain-containing protein n=1 Tax=Aspergillus sclerotialis TaxID=2070753 RepID=A0A3A2ZS09_9EURO|nr:DUF907 domain-containing protein [Aspergillus sclerotialis]